MEVDRVTGHANRQVRVQGRVVERVNQFLPVEHIDIDMVRHFGKITVQNHRQVLHPHGTQLEFPQVPVAERLAAEERTAAEWMNTQQTGVAPLVEAFQQAGVKPPAKITDTFNSWISINDPEKDSVEAAQRVLRTPPHSADSITTQFISAAISALAGLALIFLVLLRWKTRITLDDDTLTVTTFGYTARHALADLKSVDDAQWEKRGILRLTFPSGTVTLDAWHHTGVRPLAERLLPKKPDQA